jgi:hypothetical protein
MNELNFSLESLVVGRLTCDLIFASFNRLIAGVLNSINRHRLIFFENNEFEVCRKPSSRISRNKEHKS